MNFSNAAKVTATILAGDEVEKVRGNNRTKILRAANCVPPLDDEEAKRIGLKINVNFGELLVTLSHARSQLLSAFLQNQYFFTVKLPFAPAEHQSEWEQFITNEINKPLRKSLPYFELHRSRWSSVVTHGVGPMTWRHRDKWLPKFVAMGDLRIPTDTVLDFSNLAWYAERRAYTPIELVNEAFNKNANNRWDKKKVAEILKNYKELNFTDATNNYNWDTDSEKIAELMRQNGGYYGSDAVPTIPLYHFYFEDDTKDGKKWFMLVVPETGGVVRGGQEEFLWQSKDPVADSWQELLHCQFGDLSTDAPFKYHSVRGLGYVLMEPTFYMNLTRCRMLQHLNDQFNILLRLLDPGDKARAAIQEFSNLGVVRPGVEFIPQNERHQVDKSLIEMVMAQLKQLMQEGSSSYTQASDTGTQKEQTAFETRVKMEQVNAMMSGILMVAFKYESYADMEIARRFCLTDSTDTDVLKFQKRCRQTGIPPEFMDIDQWEVEPVTPLGMGNPTIAQAAAQQLMELRPMLSPQAQNEIVHENVLAITKDPRKAARWAPLSGKPTESDAKREAVGYFGTLMQGMPVKVTDSSLIDQFDALIPLYAGKINQITKRNNMASIDEAAGLMNVYSPDNPLSYLMQAMQRLDQDPQSKEKAKGYKDALANLSNEAKGLIQRGQQARMKQQGGENGNEAGNARAELQSKLQATAVTAKATSDATKAKAAQDMHHKQLAFTAEQRRLDARTHAEIQRGEVKTEADIKNEKLKAKNKPKGLTPK